MRILMSLFVLILWAATAHADIPAVHGMVIFGDSMGTYASHLPMFHAPHDRQAIFQVSLQGVPGSRALEAYAAAKASGDTLFTIEPEPMDLEKVVNGIRSEFSATIYDGHFERGGRNLGELRVKVGKVVFSSKLEAQQPPAEREKYFVFGEKGKYFAAHLIQGKPSFDAILEVGQPYQLHISHCRTRACAEPERTVIPDEKLPLVLGGPNDVRTLREGSNLSLGSILGRSADVKSVVYLEEDDLSH